MDRVLVYKSSLLPASETFIKEQAVNLKKWKPTLVGRLLVSGGLDLEGLDVRIIDRLSRWLPKQMLGFWLNRNYLWSVNVRSLRQLDAKLLHVHFGTDAIRAWPIATYLDIPMLVTLHGFDINVYPGWWEKGSGGHAMKRYPHLLRELAKEDKVRFLAVSQAIRDRAIDYGIPPEKIDVSYIGVDTKKFTPGVKPLSVRNEVLFIGRLVEKKGCIFLLEAFKRIQNEYPDIGLVVVGSGPLEDRLKQYANQNSVRVNFLGVLTPAQVLQKYGDAKVLCLPSIVAENGDAEGLPITLLEAQACGVPVITSARGGTTEGLVNEVTGLTHDETDVDGIVNALRKILNESDLAENMGLAARRKMLEKMDIDLCVKSLEELYDATSRLGTDA